jgi:hypothetical protein
MVVSEKMGGQMRQLVTRFVLLVLYLMLIWHYYRYVDHFLMAIILQLLWCLHELQMLVISVDDCLLS